MVQSLLRTPMSTTGPPNRSENVVLDRFRIRYCFPFACKRPVTAASAVASARFTCLLLVLSNSITVVAVSSACEEPMETKTVPGEVRTGPQNFSKALRLAARELIVSPVATRTTRPTAARAGTRHRWLRATCGAGGGGASLMPRSPLGSALRVSVSNGGEALGCRKCGTYDPGTSSIRISDSWLGSR